MKNLYVIKIDKAWYLYKGTPRGYSNGTVYSERTHNIKYARKFAARKDAAAVLQKFKPYIFDGSEQIISIKKNERIHI